MSFTTTLTRSWLTRSFKPFQFTNTYDNNLKYQNANNLGLYVHIPFCRTLCDFCPYCKVKYNKDQADKYIKALLKEIDMVGSQSNGNKKKVTSLYFGGGSPALLADKIKTIVDRIAKYFILTEGIGLELHPCDVTVEKLTMLKNAGISKISIGIQSFQPEYLNDLGRGKMDYTSMFEALSKVKFETVSMDFIFALPNQTIDMLKKDIEIAFNNGANHVAVYPFIDFTFTNREFIKLEEKAKKKLLYDLVDYCNQKGYVRDSIWTFSKHGNSKYSSMTRDNFLGFGCSATTLLKDQFKINTFSIDGYINRIENQSLATSLTLRFTKRQRMIYYLFWTSYSMGVDPENFKKFFGSSFEYNYGIELFIARALGLVKKENNKYLMTTRGSYYYHYYENFYTLSYIDKMWNLMRKEAFPEELHL